MSTLGKAATIVFLLFGAWFAIVGIVMDEARFDWVMIGAVVRNRILEYYTLITTIPVNHLLKKSCEYVRIMLD